MKFITLIPPNTNVNFLGQCKYFTTFSITALIICIALFFIKGFNFGIDFTGGTVVQVKFSEPTDVDHVRALVNKLGEKESSVVAIGTEKRDSLLRSSNRDGNHRSKAVG